MSGYNEQGIASTLTSKFIWSLTFSCLNKQPSPRAVRLSNFEKRMSVKPLHLACRKTVLLLFPSFAM